MTNTKIRLAAILVLGLGSASVGYARSTNESRAVTTQGDTPRAGNCGPGEIEECFIVDDRGTVVCVCV